MDNQRSAVNLAAQSFRALALSKANGEFLGSEEDLIQRFGVSRPTLRQASALVLHENLISIRRGIGGGYFARRPESISISRIAALYLQSRDAGIVEIVVAMKPLRAEIAALAACATDMDMRRLLKEVVIRDRTECAAETDTGGYRAFLRNEREFGNLLGIMSGNHVLTLMLEILYDLASLSRSKDDVFSKHAARVPTYRKARALLAEAILDNDVEVARLASLRCSNLINEWVHEDIDDRRSGWSDAHVDARSNVKSIRRLQRRHRP